MPKFRTVVVSLVLLVASVLAVSAARQDIGNIIRAKFDGTGVDLEASSGARVFVRFRMPSVVQVRVSPSGTFEQGPDYAVSYTNFADPPATKTETASQIILTDGSGVRVVIDKKPFRISILDADGKVVHQDDPAHPTWFDRSTKEFGTTKLRPSELETYYGFGEKAFPEMARNGKFYRQLEHRHLLLRRGHRPDLSIDPLLLRPARW